jgi:hypothetical protein
MANQSVQATLDGATDALCSSCRPSGESQHAIPPAVRSTTPSNPHPIRHLELQPHK